MFKVVGDIKPGHGVKGRMIQLKILEDLNEMHAVHMMLEMKYFFGII